MYQPVSLIAYDALVPEHYARLLGGCDLVVAHAGMGTVLTALEHGKPMILMPRRAQLKETRNDHQVATLQWLQGRAGIYPAAGADELKSLLDGWRETGLAPPGTIDQRPASFRGLVDTLRDFIG